MGHIYDGNTATNLASIMKGSEFVRSVYAGADLVWVLPAPAEQYMVVPYVGDVGSIPSGWYLCDGTNGTPDMRERFILGDTGEVRSTGGSATHTHTLSTEGSHNHDGYISVGTVHTHIVNGIYAGNIEIANTGTRYLFGDSTEGIHTHTVSGSTGGTHAHGGLAAATTLPPYYVVAYIMKGA
jgi:hypothetical protein